MTLANSEWLVCLLYIDWQSTHCSKEIEARYIRILGGGHQENLVRGHQEIYQDNNTSINNTFNNTKEYIRELPPSLFSFLAQLRIVAK